MKRFSIIFMVLALCLSLCACGEPSIQKEELTENSMFVVVEEYRGFSESWTVMYQKDTKVMYFVYGATTNFGNAIIMLNPDGTPQTWKGY